MLLYLSVEVIEREREYAGNFADLIYDYVMYNTINM